MTAKPYSKNKETGKSIWWIKSLDKCKNSIPNGSTFITFIFVRS